MEDDELEVDELALALELPEVLDEEDVDEEPEDEEDDSFFLAEESPEDFLSEPDRESVR